jgi:hypothetical protein
MKKLLAIVAIIMLLAAPLFAQDYVRGSGQQTTDALIVTGPGMFHGIIVSTDSANAVTLDIYDGTTATGTRLVPTITVTTSSTDRVQAIKPPGGPALFYTGLYVDITCAGTAKYVVYFK